MPTEARTKRSKVLQREGLGAWKQIRQSCQGECFHAGITLLKGPKHKEEADWRVEPAATEQVNSRRIANPPAVWSVATKQMAPRGGLKPHRPLKPCGFQIPLSIFRTMQAAHECWLSLITQVLSPLGSVRPVMSRWSQNGHSRAALLANF